MKKILLGLGTITAVAAPIVAVVSCSEIDDGEAHKLELKLLHSQGGELSDVVESTGTSKIHVVLTKQGHGNKNLRYTGGLKGGANLVNDYGRYLEENK